MPDTERANDEAVRRAAEVLIEDSWSVPVKLAIAEAVLAASGLLEERDRLRAALETAAERLEEHARRLAHRGHDVAAGCAAFDAEDARAALSPGRE